jgi:hypothetical protein
VFYFSVIHLLEILTTGGPIEAAGILAKVILIFTGLFSQIGAVVHCCVLHNKPVVSMLESY